jgi:hypothetical protein
MMVVVCLRGIHEFWVSAILVLSYERCVGSVRNRKVVAGKKRDTQSQWTLTKPSDDISWI